MGGRSQPQGGASHVHIVHARRHLGLQRAPAPPVGDGDVPPIVHCACTGETREGCQFVTPPSDVLQCPHRNC
eukprot:94766-Pyramimonas_sp.AAC.1